MYRIARVAGNERALVTARIPMLRVVTRKPDRGRIPRLPRSSEYSLQNSELRAIAKADRPAVVLLSRRCRSRHATPRQMIRPAEHRGIPMIVKKLREKKRWSQEQLATLSGLNVRTIQRVEGGQNASLETLKCLASVFEVDIATLTEEITVIDKEAEEWKRLPWWFRANMFGVNTRRQLLMIEMALLSIAFASWVLNHDPFATPMLFLSAYATGWLLRYGDRVEAWR